GLTGVLALWAMWIAVCGATWATNARIVVPLLYGVEHNGVVSAAGRVVVLVGWPIALAAIPLTAVAIERYLATPHSRRGGRLVAGLFVAAVVLCLTIAWPGAQQSGHLEARFVNVPAAVGVAILFGLTLYVPIVTGGGHGPPRRRLDLVWVAVLA